VAKKNTRNNDLLNNAKSKASPKIYALLIKLVNNDREDLADIVLRIDYLLEYASTCIKQKDYEEAKEVIEKAKTRIDMLKREGIDVEYLDYLYEGIAKKSNAN
jgi:mevalonate kinase